MTLAPSAVAEIVAPGRAMWLPDSQRIEPALAVTDGRVTTRSCTTEIAIPLPVPGETIIVDGAQHHFLGWVGDGTSAELVGLVGVFGGSGIATEVRLSPAAWDARSVVVPGASRPDDSALFGILRQLWTEKRAERAAGRAEAERVAAERLEEIVTAAHQWADRHDLCSKFDEFCSDYNLPERESEWEVTARLTIEVPVRVTVNGPSGTSEAYDAFSDSFDEDDVWSLIRTGEIDMSRITAYEVESRDAEPLD